MRRVAGFGIGGVRIKCTWNDDIGDGGVSDGGGENNNNNNKHNVTRLMIQYAAS